ncbi:NADH:ubiquinone oxidoreductase, NADH-binding subunit (chain F) [Nakamurella panacisegetis]|uniref:NADH:ubiquinone oxidoreductase, NADH-binding subunit (Chain F) n=1 Tax=Nakamurella panacisegetis TaxID=1090615 RepID=A0A1H0SAJ9_9ACTN|nr:NADH-ubiquinone oxidoreductase-F iron-sulfur binding region domain-containing protein [Nakamurella panacisegetis]SDP38812.1 NADH:ubiquinone oxidoreductase, NADH-binding subunit (chain F) [Nakamurella panacisegetis]
MTETYSPTLSAVPIARAGSNRLLPIDPVLRYADHVRHFGGIIQRTRHHLIDVVGEAGLLGRGGASVATMRKLTGVAEHTSARNPGVVVVNCCEGDPTSAKDAVLLDVSPHLVIDGAELAATAVRANRIIFVTHHGAAAADRLRQALADRPSIAARATVVGVPERFVASEATALVRYLNSGDARPAGRFSAIWKAGVDGRPTLVDNAETLAQLALVARYGANWFRSVGTAAEPGTALVTVSGAVSGPGVVEVPIGTAISVITASCGWDAGPRYASSWALVGGLAGRWLDLSRHSGVGFSNAQLSAVGATKGVASIVVLPPGGCPLTEAARILSFLADAGARQCGPCMFGLPAVAADVQALSEGDRSAANRLLRRLPTIDKRGGCGHPDGAVALAASTMNAIRSEPAHLEIHLRHGQCNSPAPIVPVGPRPADSQGGAR